MSYISSADIYNFKSITEFQFNVLQPGLNVFIGKNNSGKSNLIEAINAFFNRSNLNSDEVSKSLAYQKDTLESNPIIRLKFNNKNDVYEATFKETTEVGKLSKSLIKDKTTTFTEKEIKKGFPRFLYLSKNDDIEEVIKLIFELVPNAEVSYSKVLTNVNQFMGEIFDSTYKIYFDYRDSSSPKIRLIDEYNDDSMLENKSSGTQMAALMSLLLALGLNDMTDKGFIIAIDEPETSLHIGAQKKLFHFFKELGKKYQVIIVTHSLIFIDKTRDENVYLIERDKLGRTNFSLKKHKNENWKNLREIMGATISDSLLLGEYNIVVEGRTEQMLFPKILEILFDEGKIKLDASAFNFISGEGSAKMEPFISILKDKIELPLCIFLDNDKAGLKTKTQLEKKNKYDNDLKVIPEKDGYSESEIEDFLEENFLYECINKYYSKYITSFQEIQKEDFLKIRENTKFNVFVQKIEKMISDLYPEVNYELNKVALGLIVKENLNSSNQFIELIPYFTKVQNHFKNRR